MSIVTVSREDHERWIMQEEEIAALIEENEDLYDELSRANDRITELEDALADAAGYIRSLKARLGDEYEG